jgi:hypothetical protein
VVRRAQLTRAEALHLARAGAFEAFEPGRRRAAWEALRVAGDVLPLAPAHVLPFDPGSWTARSASSWTTWPPASAWTATPWSTCGRASTTWASRPAATCRTAGRASASSVSGLVVARQHPATAKGTVFVLLEDEFGYMNVIVPRQLYQENREVVRHAPFLAVEGRFEREDAVMNVVGRRFRELRVGPDAPRGRGAGRRKQDPPARRGPTPCRSGRGISTERRSGHGTSHCRCAGALRPFSATRRRLSSLHPHRRTPMFRRIEDFVTEWQEERSATIRCCSC